MMSSNNACERLLVYSRADGRDADASDRSPNMGRRPKCSETGRGSFEYLAVMDGDSDNRVA
jgi:hypothetical protein